jgi:hypothetical protein
MLPSVASRLSSSVGAGDCEAPIVHERPGAALAT